MGEQFISNSHIGWAEINIALEYLCSVRQQFGFMNLANAEGSLKLD